jgi:(2Fe-2S) ferredoxin
MINHPTIPYKKHIFICTNNRGVNNSMTSCGINESENLLKYLKSLLIKNGTRDVLVSQTGCLGCCKKGPVIAIYPENIWYYLKNQNDIDLIYENTIKNNIIVKELSAKKNGDK